MAAKSIKSLSDQLWTNHGVSFIPTFDNGIEPGSVIERRSWNDINHLGHMRKGLTTGVFPATSGPTACLLADFTSAHQLQVSAAIGFLQSKGSLGGKLGKVKDVIGTFDMPVIYSVDLLELADLIKMQGPPFWQKALGQALGDRRTRVAYQVIKGRIAFLFRDSGGVGVNLEVGAMGDLSSVGLGAGWRWRNEATLESKSELVLGAQMARYDKNKARFRSER